MYRVAMRKHGVIKSSRAVGGQLAHRRKRSVRSPAGPTEGAGKGISCKDYDLKWAISPRNGRKGLSQGLFHMGTCPRRSGQQPRGQEGVDVREAVIAKTTDVHITGPVVKWRCSVQRIGAQYERYGKPRRIVPACFVAVSRTLEPPDARIQLLKLLRVNR